MRLPLVPPSSAYRLRLVVGLLLVIGVLAGTWAWSLTRPVTDAVMEQQQVRLTDLAGVGTALLANTDLDLGQSADALAGTSSVRVTVIARDGTVLADSEEPTATLENHGDRPEVRTALEGSTGTDVRRSDTQGVDRMYVAVPAAYNGETVVLRVSEPLDEIEAISASTRRTGLLMLTAVLVLAAIAGWAITRSTAGPVERLAASARAMADGDLTTPVPAGDSALAPLADALGDLRDQLRDRLDALETEQRTLRIALDGLGDAVLLFDAGSVRFANRALRTLFRVPPGELRGRALAGLGLPASIEAVIAEGLTSSETRTADLGPDPFHRYHRVMVVPLGDAEGSPRSLAVISDVTDRLRLDAVRRDFVANASHELKTPVAGIHLLAESARDAASAGDTQQALAFVSQIAEESARLKRLVADLLDLSRAESAPDEGAVADVRRALELALAGHRRAAAEKGLSLDADLTAVAGVDIAVRCSPTDVAIVLDNLLSNAIAYTENGGVTVRLLADDSFVTVDVTDTGIGIPASDLERVFERFYRVDKGRSRTSGGTGLGLSLVRNIVERCGGTASMASEPGAGTTATIRLPRAR